MMKAEHLVFQRDGTRYDLVLVDDPYGGVLVIWRDGQMTWRWDQGDRLKPLSKGNNKFDAENIFRYLEALP